MSNDPFEGHGYGGGGHSNLHDALSPGPDIEGSRDISNPPSFPTVPERTAPQEFSYSPEVQTAMSEAPNLLSQPEPEDPQVAALRAMFPDFESVVLQSILESVNGDQDRAIDTLLGMSDPDYVPQAPSAQPEPTQTDLDEQFARRLMLEEEQAAAQRQQSRNSRSDNDSYHGVYQPRVRGGRGAQQPQPQPQQPGSALNVDPSGQRDTVAEIQESFSKIAENGKRTFGNIVSKVKAKMQEFDQSRQGGGSNYGGTQPTWTGAGQQNTYYSQQQEPSYYDPNPARTSSPAPIIAAPRPVQGYDAAPGNPPRESLEYLDRPILPSSGNDVSVNNTKSILANATPTHTTSGSVGGNSSLGSTIPRPNSGPPPNLIDRGKLGLLPKRPVSLLRPTTPQTQPQRRHDDEDELDYTENPFDDDDHK